MIEIESCFIIRAWINFFEAPKTGVSLPGPVSKFIFIWIYGKDNISKKNLWSGGLNDALNNTPKP